MMFQVKSVGVDIQPDMLRVAVAVSQGGRVKILGLLEKELPRDDEGEATGVTEAIRELFAEAGADDGACVTCLPAASSINRHMSMPIADAAKIKQTLKFQLEPQIPYPVDQVISDFMSVRKVDDGSEILAISVTKESVSERLQPLQSAGVNPQILTLDALALADFYITPFDFSEDRVTAMLIAGAASSFLGFFLGETLIGYRSLSGVGTGDGDAVNGIAKELRRSLVGFQTSAGENLEIGALCVGGTGGDLLREYLSEQFRDFPIRTVEFNERNLAEIPSDFAGLTDDFRLAIALAYAGLEPSANSINFMQEEFAPPSVLSRLLPHIKFSLGVLAIVFVAWFAGMWAQIYSQTRQIDALNEKMSEIFADMMPGIRSADDAEQGVNDLKKTFESLRNYSSEYVSPLDALREVDACAKATGKNLLLKDMTISKDELAMRGVADSFDDIDAFKKRIEQSALFSNVSEGTPGKMQKSHKVSFGFKVTIARESASSVGSSSGGDS